MQYFIIQFLIAAGKFTFAFDTQRKMDTVYSKPPYFLNYEKSNVKVWSIDHFNSYT